MEESSTTGDVCGLVPTETSALPHRMSVFGQRPPSGWRSGRDQFGRWAGHPVLGRCRPLPPDHPEILEALGL